VKIKKGLASYKPYSKRMEIVKLPGGVLAINDTYNANPESFLSALETLGKIPAKGKKYVIAGDMFELGENSKIEHHRLGRAMAKYEFNGYFFTGHEMEWTWHSLLRANPMLNSSHEGNLDYSKPNIAHYLRKHLKRGDVVLVKGSRGMKMETIIEQLGITN